jgi:diguanylate cyclase (GGDEF)-like protein
LGLFALLIFLTAANLCLGYGVAVYLGYGPASFHAAWDALAGRPEAPGEAADGGEADLVRSLADEFAAISAEESFDDELANEVDVELSVEPYDDGGDSAAVAADEVENWDLNEKFVETSILKLNIAMMKSGIRATDIDSRLRACQGHTDGETIRQCVEALKEDCEVFLAEQAEAAANLHERISELGELASLGEEIEMSNLQQGAQVETTLSNLAHMDFESDLEAANVRLLEELKHLRIARHALRDSQEAAFVTVARYEGRLDKVEKRLFNDTLTEMRNRIGLEATLWQWWQEGRPKTRPMSASLFDLNSFGRVNDQHGSAVGDRALRHVAEVLQKTLPPADLPARMGGQRFLVMHVDAGPRVAMKNAEFVRQSISRITFRCGGEEFQLTASVGITEVKADDTQEGLLKRLEATLAQAKAAGPNTAFATGAREPEPVESPNLGAEYREIEI